MVCRQLLCCPSGEIPGTGRLRQRHRRRTRHRWPWCRVREADLPQAWPAREPRPGGDSHLPQQAALGRLQAHRHLGMEFWRIQHTHEHVRRPSRLLCRRCRGTSHIMALLRHRLHRALHAHTQGEPRRL